MTNQEHLQEQNPLSEATLFILLSLSAEPRHGYAIMKDVEIMSQGQVSLSTGTLYGALRRLLEDGWIRRSGDVASSEQGRARKVYTLTDLGRRILNTEVARLEMLVTTAHLRLAPGQS
jgi:DNA-binding PadR family transcriptional regulator